jgi:hypothetical protein
MCTSCIGAEAAAAAAVLSVSAALDAVHKELASLQEISRDAEDVLANAATGQAELPASLRSQLAQLHGTASNVVGRLDSLLTGELSVGHAEVARARRKSLVAVCEALIADCERQVSMIDQHGRIVADDDLPGYREATKEAAEPEALAAVRVAGEDASPSGDVCV